MEPCYLASPSPPLLEPLITSHRMVPSLPTPRLLLVVPGSWERQGQPSAALSSLPTGPFGLSAKGSKTPRIAQLRLPQHPSSLCYQEHGLESDRTSSKSLLWCKLGTEQLYLPGFAYKPSLLTPSARPTPLAQKQRLL